MKFEIIDVDDKFLSDNNKDIYRIVHVRVTFPDGTQRVYKPMLSPVDFYDNDADQFDIARLQNYLSTSISSYVKEAEQRRIQKEATKKFCNRFESNIKSLTWELE